jgi:hypothetical protein
MGGQKIPWDCGGTIMLRPLLPLTVDMYRHLPAKWRRKNLAERVAGFIREGLLDVCPVREGPLEELCYLPYLYKTHNIPRSGINWQLEPYACQEISNLFIYY